MALWSHLRFLARRLDRRRAEKELDDELRAHLELEIEGNLAAGMSPEEARRAARRKLGNLAIARQDVRALWELPAVETTWIDLRHAARVLRARPGYTLAAVVSLALGIGVCTAVWTVVDRVVLRPLPYSDPDRIVELREVSATGSRMRVAEPNVRDVRARSGAFDALAPYASDTMTVTGGERSVRARVVVAARDFFRVFQVEPALGRAFLPEESAPGGPPVAVVGHAFWRRVLGERVDLGRVRIDDESYTVVGVMPLTGIYGVTAYSVAQRTHEIGIRMALGARPRAILGMVLREGALLALSGVAIGALAAAALTRLIASWLHGVSAADPATFAVVGLALAGAAVLACWLPARRAVRVDPMAALRSE